MRQRALLSAQSEASQIELPRQTRIAQHAHDTRRQSGDRSHYGVATTRRETGNYLLEERSALQITQVHTLQQHVHQLHPAARPHEKTMPRQQRCTLS